MGNIEKVKPVVFEHDGKIYASSIDVAKYFGKRHDNVLQRIESVMEKADDVNALNFKAVEYLDQKGEMRKCYEMTKDGFVFLVMGFTGKEADKFKWSYIAEFNRKEQELQLARSQPVKIITKTRQPKIDNKRIKLALRLHEECGWNKSDIACLMDVSRQSVSGWIHGIRRPKDLARIKQAVNRQLERENKNLQKLAFIERFLASAPVDTIEYHVPIIHDMISSIVDDMYGV